MKSIVKRLKSITRLSQRNHSLNNDKTSLISIIALAVSFVSVLLLGISLYYQFFNKTTSAILCVSAVYLEEDNQINSNIFIHNTGNQYLTVNGCKFIFNYGRDEGTATELLTKFLTTNIDSGYIEPFSLKPNEHKIINISQTFNFIHDIVSTRIGQEVKLKGLMTDTIHMFLTMEYFDSRGYLSYSSSHIGELIVDMPNIGKTENDDYVHLPETIKKVLLNHTTHQLNSLINSGDFVTFSEIHEDETNDNN